MTNLTEKINQINNKNIQSIESYKNDNYELLEMLDPFEEDDKLSADLPLFIEGSQLKDIKQSLIEAKNYFISAMQQVIETSSVEQLILSLNSRELTELYTDGWLFNSDVLDSTQIAKIDFKLNEDNKVKIIGFNFGTYLSGTDQCEIAREFFIDHPILVELQKEKDVFTPSIMEEIHQFVTLNLDENENLLILDCNEAVTFRGSYISQVLNLNNINAYHGLASELTIKNVHLFLEDKKIDKVYLHFHPYRILDNPDEFKILKQAYQLNIFNFIVDPFSIVLSHPKNLKYLPSNMRTEIYEVPTKNCIIKNPDLWRESSILPPSDALPKNAIFQEYINSSDKLYFKNNKWVPQQTTYSFILINEKLSAQMTRSGEISKSPGIEFNIVFSGY